MGDVISEIFDIEMRPSLDSLIFQFLFYGIYLILGGVCISLQLQQYRSQSKKKFQHPFYPISLVVLFILATAGIIVSVYEVENIIQLFMADAFVKQDLPHRWELFMSYRTAIGSIYTTANWVADAILVYRCYHVWNGKIWIPLVPGVLSVIDTGIGYASVAATKLGSGVLIANGYSHEVIVADDLGYLFLAMNAFNNVVLTALIAGKIWSLNRVHSQLLGTGGGDKRLNAIVSIFIESGTIYPVALIICLIIQVKQSPATMDPILLQIVGIAPTLIMVRTYLSLDSRIPQKDAETELGKANLSSRVTSDIKDTLSASTPSPYQPIFTLPSDYVYTPLLSPQSSYGGGSSMYSADISHNSFQPTMKTANYEDGEIADGTGFIPEKTFVELRYQALSLQSSPAQMLFSSEKGTSGEPSSLRSAYFKDNDRYFAH